MNNLKSIRQSYGYSQTKVAEYLGIQPSGYNHYESGRNRPSVDTLNKLAKLYGVSIEELIGEKEVSSEGQPHGSFEAIDSGEIQIPLVASLRCGPVKKGEEPFTFIKPVAVPKSFARRWGDSLQALIAVGESMSPTIIPGDMLICRPGEEWADGNVVSVNLDDIDMIKRIYKAEDGGICLRSDNPKFEAIRVSADEIEAGRIHVLGRVLIAIGKEL